MFDCYFYQDFLLSLLPLDGFRYRFSEADIFAAAMMPLMPMLSPLMLFLCCFRYAGFFIFFFRHY